MKEVLYAIVTGILAWIMICNNGLKLFEFYVTGIGNSIERWLRRTLVRLDLCSANY
jgi:hypothetical protein